jgi:uncharacterized SAM-binding protein YcdF (DUF218 family)
MTASTPDYCQRVLLSWGPALLAAILFLGAMRRDRRRVANAVLLGLTVVLAAAPWSWSTPARYVVLLALGVVLPLALLANGVQMVRRERRRLGHLLSLLTGLAIVAVDVAGLIALGGHGALPIALGVVVVLSGYAGFFAVSVLLYSLAYGATVRRSRFGALIVLGSRVTGNRVSGVLRRRLDRALSLYRRQDPGPLLVVTGGQGADEQITEAAAMRGYLLDNAVPEDHVVVEDRATTTEENLRYSVALLTERDTPGPVAAVTNNYHAFRTAVLARKLGMPVEAMGAPTPRHYLPSAFLREVVALMYEDRIAHAVACAAVVVAYLLIALT